MSFSVIAILLLLLVVHDVTSAPTSRNLPSQAEFIDTTNCNAGEFFDNVSGRCQPCQDGTFVTAEMAHKERRYHCQRCQSADTYANEVAVEPCTKTRDAVIKCKENYYRKKLAPSPKECLDCQFACTPCDVCDAQTTVQPKNTGVSTLSTTNPTMRTTKPTVRTTEPTVRTTESTTSQHNKYYQISSANSPLLVFAFLLSLFVRHISS